MFSVKDTKNKYNTFGATGTKIQTRSTQRKVYGSVIGMKFVPSPRTGQSLTFFELLTVGELADEPADNSVWKEVSLDDNWKIDIVNF